MVPWCQDVARARTAASPFCQRLFTREAGRPVVDLGDLADDRWMVDPSVDGEWDGVRRVLGAAGIDPPVLHGDYLTAASLVVLGEAVAPCRPTSGPRDDMAIRPLRGDPPAVRLLLVSRPGTDTDAVYEELEAAYRDAARRAGGSSPAAAAPPQPSRAHAVNRRVPRSAESEVPFPPSAPTGTITP